MKPAFFIARRYLFAKKSHNVINVISLISTAGIAIGCAALVIILSVYNGFNDFLKSLYESSEADLVISPAKGKVFSPTDEKFDAIRSDAGVVSFCEILEENIFLQYGGRTSLATARGVDQEYLNVTELEQYLINGEFKLGYGSVPEMVLGRTVAATLGVNPSFTTPIQAYFPSRTGEVSLIDPTSSLHSIKLFPAGILAIDQYFDRKYVIMPIRSMRNLLEYKDEVSSIELRLSPELTSNATHGVSPQYQSKIESLLGGDFEVKNKFQQKESLYKLMTYEKTAIYLILLFVVLIISCNIFGSLSMLVIEKKEDISVLRSMGADNNLIKKIFRTEGRMISALGIVTGIAIGLLVCYLQQRFGFVKMPGNFVIEAYPVSVRWSDVLLIFCSVAAIGYLMARGPKIPEAEN